MTDTLNTLNCVCGGSDDCPTCGGLGAVYTHLTPEDDEFWEAVPDDPHNGELVAAYLETVLWSETDDDGEPLDRTFVMADFDIDTIRQAIADCERFEELARLRCSEIGADFDGFDLELIGHCFWLNRCGHGTGFWDREEFGDLQTPFSGLASSFGERWVYVGDDDKLHIG